MQTQYHEDCADPNCKGDCQSVYCKVVRKMREAINNRRAEQLNETLSRGISQRLKESLLTERFK